MNTLLLVGIGVGVALNGTGLSAEETVQSRANLVAAVLLNGVALRTSRLEQVGTLFDVACMSYQQGLSCDCCEPPRGHGGCERWEMLRLRG